MHARVMVDDLPKGIFVHPLFVPQQGRAYRDFSWRPVAQRSERTDAVKATTENPKKATGSRMTLEQERQQLLLCFLAYRDERDTAAAHELSKMAADSEHEEIREEARRILADPPLRQAVLNSPVGGPRYLEPK